MVMVKTHSFFDPKLALNRHRLKSFLEYTRNAITAHLNQEVLRPKPKLSHGLKPMGVYVTLEKENRLRGCMGHLEPEFEDLCKEVSTCAIAAATQDPRFSPLSLQELAETHIKLSFLSPPEPIDSVELLDPKNYGVIVEYAQKKGTLLPDLNGIDTVEHQISIACQKAGITPDEPYHLKRYLALKVAE